MHILIISACPNESRTLQFCHGPFFPSDWVIGATTTTSTTPSPLPPLFHPKDMQTPCIPNNSTLCSDNSLFLQNNHS